MLKILLVISPLFLIIFASAIVQRIKNIDESWSIVLNKFALNVGLPALIFAVLAKTNISFTNELDIIIANSIFMIAGFVVAFLFSKVLRLSKKMARTLFISLAFGNIAYLGIPVLTQIYGESVLPSVSIIVAIYLFWIFTIGIAYLDYSTSRNKKDVFSNILKNLVKNPLLIAIILGIVVAVLKIKIPDAAMSAITMVKGAVTPVVLIVIGLFIGRLKIGKLKEWIPVFGFSLVTLLVLPALFYFSVLIFGFSIENFSVSIIEAAMPLAITPFALADKYKLEKKLIARAIVLSTVLSAITIPFWTSLLQ